MLCARARHPTEPENRAKPFHTKACPHLWLFSMPEPSRPQAVEDHSCNKSQAKNLQLARILSRTSKALSSATIGVFEVLFPQFQSRFSSSQNVVFDVLGHQNASPPCLAAFIFQKREILLFGSHSSSLLPLTYSFLCSALTIPHSHCLQFPCRSPGKRHANQRLPPVLRNVIDIDARFLWSQLLLF